jgi:hypothetical protein
MKTNMTEIIVATLRTALIVPPLKRNWKWFRVASLLAILALGAGCGGIRASKSVSPASFLIPGLLKNDVPDAQDSTVPASPPGELLAQN